MTWLLDGNVLVALVLDHHTQHERAVRWYAARKRRRFATCLVTQGTLLRLHMTYALDRSAAAAWATLAAIEEHPQHAYWDDAFAYSHVDHRHLQGAGQVTDAWLAALARRRKGRVATLDQAFATLHADAVELVPVV